MESGSLNLVLVSDKTHDPLITSQMLYQLSYNYSHVWRVDHLTWFK